MRDSGQGALNREAVRVYTGTSKRSERGWYTAILNHVREIDKKQREREETK